MSFGEFGPFVGERKWNLWGIHNVSRFFYAKKKTDMSIFAHTAHKTYHFWPVGSQVGWKLKVLQQDVGKRNSPFIIHPNSMHNSSGDLGPKIFHEWLPIFASWVWRRGNISKGGISEGGISRSNISTKQITVWHTSPGALWLRPCGMVSTEGNWWLIVRDGSNFSLIKTWIGDDMRTWRESPCFG